MATVRYTTIWIIVALTLGLLAAPLPIDALQARKVYRIGFLYRGSAASGAASGTLEAFREGLREYGWVEGQNITVEYRYANHQPEAYARLATELARLKVDVIFVTTTPPTRAVMQATTTIPIVFAYVADAVASGFVESLARPGGNATGISDVGSGIAGKQLELLTEVKPDLTRVIFLGNFNNPAIAQHFQQMQHDAEQLGVTLRRLTAHSHDELEQAFATITREGADALFVYVNLYRYRKEIVEFARTHHLLTMTNMKRMVQDGGLMSYASSMLDNYRSAAPYIDKILRGAQPADLPVSRPTRFDLVINLKTAKALGLTIPPTILIQATEVIQ